MNQVYIVVFVASYFGVSEFIMCQTDEGGPAVYADTPSAELRCAQLRERNPNGTYRVVSSPVL